MQAWKSGYKGVDCGFTIGERWKEVDQITTDAQGQVRFPPVYWNGKICRVLKIDNHADRYDMGLVKITNNYPTVVLIEEDFVFAQDAKRFDERGPTRMSGGRMCHGYLKDGSKVNCDKLEQLLGTSPQNVLKTWVVPDPFSKWVYLDKHPSDDAVMVHGVRVGTNKIPDHLHKGEIHFANVPE